MLFATAGFAHLRQGVLSFSSFTPADSAAVNRGAPCALEACWQRLVRVPSSPSWHISLFMALLLAIRAIRLARIVIVFRAFSWECFKK